MLGWRVLILQMKPLSINSTLSKEWFINLILARNRYYLTLPIRLFKIYTYFFLPSSLIL